MKLLYVLPVILVFPLVLLLVGRVERSSVLKRNALERSESGLEQLPMTKLPLVRLQRALRPPESPAEVRSLLRATESARRGDVQTLRDAALCSEDPLLAGNAIRALARLDALHADEDLLTLIDDPRSRVRHELVRGLGMASRPTSAERDRVVELLLTVVRCDDVDAGALALQSLGRLGGQDAQSILAQVAASPSSTRMQRAFANQALRGPAKIVTVTSRVPETDTSAPGASKRQSVD